MGEGIMKISASGYPGRCSKLASGIYRKKNLRQSVAGEGGFTFSLVDLGEIGFNGGLKRAGAESVRTQAAGVDDVNFLCIRLAVATYAWIALGTHDLPIFDWTLFNGALADSLNSGKITTSRLPKSATDPGVQCKVDLKNYDGSKDVIIQVIASHSTALQPIDVDLNYVEVGPGENFNTEAPGATLNAVPTTPATAYERFTFTFTIPAADINSNGSLELQLSRDTAGADTGDLHIWEIRAYQQG